MYSKPSLAPAEARRPAEPVDRDRVDPVLREPQRELLVVGVEAADVGQDHDPAPLGSAARAWNALSRLPSAAVRVSSRRVERAAGDRQDRRSRVEVEAHGRVSRVTQSADRPPAMPRWPRFGLGRRSATFGACASRAVEWRRCLPPARRPEVRRLEPRRRGPDPARRAADRARARRPARTSSSSCPRWATRPTSSSSLAAAITDTPDERELDMLLATGEHQSATLVSMALHALGVAAISLSGPQAGITTDGRYGKARIASIEPARVETRARRGQGRDRGRFQGRADAGGAATSPAPTSRRSAAAAATRPRSRSRPGWARTAARSSPTSAASTPPTRGSPPRPAS